MQGGSATVGGRRAVARFPRQCTLNPDRVGPICRILGAELYRHARIRINGVREKPKWNLGSIRPEFCDVLERLAQEVDPGARAWRGSDLLAAQQGVVVLGTPLGRAEFVHAQLNQKLADHEILFCIPLLADVQSAWALLLCRGTGQLHVACGQT